jgi:hypothetical protein
MSFTLVPKYGEARKVNVWVWRPTLELIRDAKLIDEKSYKKMGLNDGEVQVDAVTAWKIADLIDRTVEKMGPKDKLLLDLSISDRPDKRGGVLKTEEDVLEGYSVGREWLKDFSAFSRDSGGFGVF